jgi:hypothetical protein
MFSYRSWLLIVGVIVISSFAVDASAEDCTVTWADGTKQGCDDWYQAPGETSSGTTGGSGKPWWCFWCPDEPEDCPERGDNCGQCQAYCKCVYDRNIKECERQLACQELAKDEFEACEGNCLTDFVDC